MMGKMSPEGEGDSALAAFPMPGLAPCDRTSGTFQTLSESAEGGEGTESPAGCGVHGELRGLRKNPTSVAQRRAGRAALTWSTPESTPGNMKTVTRGAERR